MREFDAAGGGDRQAREPVRRRGRRDDRGGLGARARRRPGLGLRLRRRCSTARSTPRSAARIAEHFVEVLLAPEYDDDALEALGAKPALRILRDRERRVGDAGRARLQARARRPARAGARRRHRRPRGDADRRAATLDEAQWGDLLFAWRVCKHVSSNAIVLAKGLPDDRRSAPAR